MILHSDQTLNHFILILSAWPYSTSTRPYAAGGGEIGDGLCPDNRMPPVIDRLPAGRYTGLIIEDEQSTDETQ
jgi:hypothetical protein